MIQALDDAPLWAIGVGAVVIILLSELAKRRLR